MYQALLYTHSFLRFLVLVLLVLVIIKAFLGMSGKKAFGKTDNLLSLSLFSATHTQLLVGILLYFFSPWVVFSGDTMKDAGLRYWAVEHNTMMLIAIVLITLARTTTKKMSDDFAKHRRQLYFNGLALVIILAAIYFSKRGFFTIAGTAVDM
jgi:hypothetical protein